MKEDLLLQCIDRQSLGFCCVCESKSIFEFKSRICLTIFNMYHPYMRPWGKNDISQQNYNRYGADIVKCNLCIRNEN